MPPLPRVLTIAGSDSGGGAGIQADLKTFFAHGCYGASVITALTAQNTLGVQAVHEVPASFVAAQLESVMSDIGFDAVKTGMLANAAIIEVVARALERRSAGRFVVDPVMVSKNGHRLLSPDAIDALRGQLIPLATVLTPNLDEVEDLLGTRPRNESEMRDAARALHSLGAQAVLVKGGHLGFEAAVPEVPEVPLPPSASSNDILFDGTEFLVLTAPRIDTPHTHGTGCTLSAAIAANLALGHTVLESCQRAKAYLTGALRTAQPLGSGIGPLNHGWQLPVDRGK